MFNFFFYNAWTRHGGAKERGKGGVGEREGEKSRSADGEYRFPALTVRGHQLVRESELHGHLPCLDVYLGPIIYDYDYSGRLSSALY